MLNTNRENNIRLNASRPFALCIASSTIKKSIALTHRLVDMASDHAVLEAALVCLHRNADRCVVPDEKYTVYSVNKKQSIPKIRLRIPSSHALLEMERHLTGDAKLKE